jgi:hypothetical protein
MEHGFHEFDMDFLIIKRFVTYIIENVFNELDRTGGTDGFFKNYFKLI